MGLNTTLGGSPAGFEEQRPEGSYSNTDRRSCFGSLDCCLTGAQDCIKALGSRRKFNESLRGEEMMADLTPEPMLRIAIVFLWPQKSTLHRTPDKLTDCLDVLSGAMTPLLRNKLLHMAVLKETWSSAQVVAALAFF